MAEKNTSVPLLLASSPHIASPVKTRLIMANMYVALAPVSVFGVIIFGLPALLNIVVAVVSAILGEALFRLATRQQVRVTDLSAGITGLLLALIVPPSLPLWMTALGSVFGVVVAKEFFGGLGANFFNPALIGRAFLQMSFPAAMTKWHIPQAVFPLTLTDATSGASLLGKMYTVKDAVESYSGIIRNLFHENGILKSLFFGFRPGSTGETSALLILAAFLYLLLSRTIQWQTTVSMVAAAFITAFAFRLDPLVAVLSGGLLFGAVYMATDYATSPIFPWGKVVFGAGAGIITVLIRKFGDFPEGVCYSILIMNCAVPFLNKMLPKKYGFIPQKRKGVK